MGKSLVSVIITTFNRADYIKYSIESVLEQAYKHFELIIVDDGSTDNTVDIVKSYNDKRIRYFYQTNLGQNFARNYGLQVSKGKYAAFLDSDDVWENNKLEKQVEILDKHADIGLVYCATSIIDKHNREIERQKLHNYCGNVTNQLLLLNFLYNISCAMFRIDESLYRVGMFDESITKMTDWEFYLKYSLHNKFYSIPEYLVKHRVLGNSINFNYMEHLVSGFRIFDKFFQNKDLPGSVIKKKELAYAMQYRHLAQKFLDNGKYIEARVYILKAFAQTGDIIWEKDGIFTFVKCFLPYRLFKFISYFKKYLCKEIVRLRANEV